MKTQKHVKMGLEKRQEAAERYRDKRKRRQKCKSYKIRIVGRRLIKNEEEEEEEEEGRRCRRTRMVWP
jgi:mRNA-degrading endonuclease RelE of RelBE toxin-antitoxin system